MTHFIRTEPDRHIERRGAACWRPATVAALLLGCAGLSAAQQAYDSPERASDALVAAVRASDEGALRTVLGANWRKYIPAGSVDREDVEAFLQAWDTSHKVYEEVGGTSVVSAGNAGWTLPIPMVKSAAGWRFDLKAGADEMRTRRIGRNELSAMQASLAYHDAQNEYALLDRDGNGVLEYAKKFVSSPGKRDGLYWPSASAQDESPLGPLFAGRKTKGGPGYHGYHFKILTAQGWNAPGGGYSYLTSGRMRSGFALIAWPVRYGDTGVTSFMISHDGNLLEKDLGPQTDFTASSTVIFNPDLSWKKAEVPGS